MFVNFGVFCNENDAISISIFYNFIHGYSDLYKERNTIQGNEYWIFATKIYTKKYLKIKEINSYNKGNQMLLAFDCSWFMESLIGVNSCRLWVLF